MVPAEPAFFHGPRGGARIYILLIAPIVARKLTRP
jgi:hypothetical protein